VLVFDFFKKGSDSDKPPDNFKNESTNNCYESTQFKETCQTNSLGELVCNRIKQIWRHCPDKKPVLISSEKEENVPTQMNTISIDMDIPKPLFDPFPEGDIFDSLHKLFDRMTQEHMRVFTPGPDIYRAPPPERSRHPDFPEPEDWRKK